MKHPKTSIFILAAAITVFTFCRPATNDNKQQQAAGGYALVEAFPALGSFDVPVELTSPADGTDRIFVVSQKGIVSAFANKADVKSSQVFLDISSKVSHGGETGLLGLAFSPNFKTDGYFYVNYTRLNPSLQTVIARYKVSAADANLADPNSEQILFTFAQPFDNHNGGKVAFGNDGFLYISAGDGGSGGDPQNNGQNKATFLGKMLRIDVNKTEAGKPYAIPADNPFKGNKEGFKEEIYAYGLRNVWRFNFDHTTGMLWAADVGQDKIEEIDIIENGGNYGWNVMEANECFKSAGCDKTGLSLPVFSYNHGVGTSITGGYVCRDKNLPALNGKYIYGDYTSGSIWALSYSGNKSTGNDQIAKVNPGSLSSFGEDSKNNLYVLNYNYGKIYKILAAK